MAHSINHKAILLVAITATAAGLAALAFWSSRRRRRNHRSISAERFADAFTRQEITVVEDVGEIPRLVSRLIKDLKEQKVLGLDCEWNSRGDKVRPIALLQLAAPDGICILVRLCKLRDIAKWPELSDLLSDKSILKVGVGILEDAKKLVRDYGLVTRGCIDLRHLALRHLPRGTQLSGGGLAELAQVCLHYELDKSWQLRRSDWEAPVLTPEQMKYAALDACVATGIFFELVTSKSPNITDWGELDWPTVTALCQGLVDTKFKGKFHLNEGSGKVIGSKGKKRKEDQSLESLRERPLSKVYVARKEPLYDNCKLASPDGMLLCSCDRKKAEWYVAKGIGEVVSENPLHVRLKFEPAGIPGPDREYYLQDKANMCVVCGRTDSYIRKNVVPHEYRRYFPDYLKKHSSHDVLLLCVECHQCSWTYDSLLRQRLAEEYHAPIDNQSNAPTKEDPLKTRVKSAAKALQRNVASHKIPQERVAELEQVLEDHFEVPSVDQELLDMAVRMNTKVSNELFDMFHGEKVIGVVSEEVDGYARFEKRWRVHFLDNMKPRFMPALWSVDHKHESAVAKREMAAREMDNGSWPGS